MNPYWDELPIHVVDFEGSAHCGIVEFGVVTLHGCSIAATATRLCRPKARIPRKEQAAHGISDALADGCKPFADEWDRFASMRQSGPLAGHFASAESAMLRAAFPFPRLSADWIREDRKTADWGPWIDTGYLYRNNGDDPGSYKLEHLVQHFELQRELADLAAAHCPPARANYHCALYDALASSLLFLLYCREIADERPTLRQLIAFSQGSGERKQQVEQENLF